LYDPDEGRRVKRAQGLEREATLAQTILNRFEEMLAGETKLESGEEDLLAELQEYLGLKQNETQLSEGYIFLKQNTAAGVVLDQLEETSGIVDLRAMEEKGRQAVSEAQMLKVAIKLRHAAPTSVAAEMIRRYEMRPKDDRVRTRAGIIQATSQGELIAGSIKDELVSRPDQLIENLGNKVLAICEYIASQHGAFPHTLFRKMSQMLQQLELFTDSEYDFETVLRSPELLAHFFRDQAIFTFFHLIDQMVNLPELPERTSPQQKHLARIVGTTDITMIISDLRAQLQTARSQHTAVERINQELALHPANNLEHIQSTDEAIHTNTTALEHVRRTLAELRKKDAHEEVFQILIGKSAPTNVAALAIIQNTTLELLRKGSDTRPYANIF